VVVVVVERGGALGAAPTRAKQQQRTGVGCPTRTGARR
jgi:hypothetical protein